MDNYWINRRQANSPNQRAAGLWTIRYKFMKTRDGVKCIKVKATPQKS